MKVIQISEELYDKLKKFIIDPFDDTPESVVGRLIDIVDKSKSRFSAWDATEDTGQQLKSQDGPTTPSKSQNVRAARNGSGHDEFIL